MTNKETAELREDGRTLGTEHEERLKLSRRAIEPHLVDEIHVPVDRRALDEKTVAALAQSIRTIGLQTPITVRMTRTLRPVKGQIEEAHLVLVAGAHRLAAVKRLGRDRIDCFITDESEEDITIWICDENLCRAELDQSQIAYYTGLREVAWKAKHSAASPSNAILSHREHISSVPHAEVQTERTQSPPSINRNGKLAGYQHQKGFTADQAAKTGMTTRSIRRALHRARHIEPDILRTLKGTSLSTGPELDALARKPPEEQRALAAQAQTRARVSAREPALPIKTAPPDDASETARNHANAAGDQDAGRPGTGELPGLCEPLPAASRTLAPSYDPGSDADPGFPEPAGAGAPATLERPNCLGGYEQCERALDAIWFRMPKAWRDQWFARILDLLQDEQRTRWFTLIWETASEEWRIDRLTNLKRPALSH